MKDFWSKVTARNLLINNKRKLKSLKETTFYKKKIKNNKIQIAFHYYWHIIDLLIFQEQQKTAFERNKNLKEMTWDTHIENGKAKKLNISCKMGKCTRCLSWARKLCCNQVKTTTRVMTQQAKQPLNIFFKLNCKSEYLITWWNAYNMHDPIYRKSIDSI